MASGSLKMSRGRHGTVCSAARRDRSPHGRTRPVGDERRMIPSKEARSSGLRGSTRPAM